MTRGAENSSARTWWSGIRVAAMAITAVIVFVVTLGPLGWVQAVAVGWIAAAILYLAWVWIAVGSFDPQQTAAHAVREDPSRAYADILLLVSAVASLGAVVGLVMSAATAEPSDRGFLATTAIASVFLAWLLVHTLYMLRYAALYYADGSDSVDFNGDENPQYSDFAYLAFTIGMTYQVSDTNLTGRRMRATALRHALLSFVLGAVILATVINLIAGLAA